MTDLTHERTVQPLPKSGPATDALGDILAANARKAKRERLTLIRMFGKLRACG
jgi:hypothetical protein